MKARTFNVALAQVDAVIGDVPANAARAEQAIAEARELGANIVVFPELNLTGYALAELTDTLAIPANDEVLLELSYLAGDIDLVVGFVESGRLHVYNSIAYLSGGAVTHVHRKIFLPTYASFNEWEHFVPGHSLRAFDTRFGRMGMLICNDAWHQELPYMIVQDGARVLFVPACSALPHNPEVTGDYTRDWAWICRYNARFLQCYVVFVNRVGQEATRDFWGGSMVVAPNGEVIARAPRQVEELTLAEIDFTQVWRARRALPLLKEARMPLLARELNRMIAEEADG